MLPFAATLESLSTNGYPLAANLRASEGLDHAIGSMLRYFDERKTITHLDRPNVLPAQARFIRDRADEIRRASARSPAKADVKARHSRPNFSVLLSGRVLPGRSRFRWQRRFFS